MDWSRQDGNQKPRHRAWLLSLNSVKSQNHGQARHSGLL